MLENTKAILDGIVEGRKMRRMMVDFSLPELFSALDEVKAAEAEIEELKKELAELKERAAQDAINSLRGNTGGEYK